MLAFADVHVAAERIVQSLDPRFERHDNRANHHADENAQLGETRQDLRLVEFKANGRKGDAASKIFSSMTTDGRPLS